MAKVYDPKQIRKTAAGYIGGEDVALLATDPEVVMLAIAQDEIAELTNRIAELTNRLTARKKRVEQCQKVIISRTLKQAQKMQKAYRYNPNLTA